ncbi:hypothetical protein DFA_11208 [Cavenderia fasciculata]|uniref:Uncharacterized protein n=1 Tax=Cavenderia fasciculata TaxID=261658 RepID=F4QFE0_CACFS|nr:uncharacterized protein DFA_11208 [Cavenderia fasciculata]EGG13447.1 hypothetical protein DFA_11208 [Cavenderia fasciculata]|eukprot:XP_004350151.1 hypothetical protein DFA_11208 [Cavenderia fasciculata]
MYVLIATLITFQTTGIKDYVHPPLIRGGLQAEILDNLEENIFSFNVDIFYRFQYLFSLLEKDKDPFSAFLVTGLDRIFNNKT